MALQMIAMIITPETREGKMRYSFLICKPQNDYDVTWALRKYLVEGEYSLKKQELFLPFDVERMYLQ